ncbi:hypothetical protein SAMN05720471_1531 [Fibrobacter sp. UWP2]|nr:hypothetical protein SAMN05720471_1531 [Fibrobacter sp. UWP2]
MLGVFLLNQIYKLETTFFFLVAEISTNFGASSKTNVNSVECLKKEMLR